jgi:hypothetical protein
MTSNAALKELCALEETTSALERLWLASRFGESNVKGQRDYAATIRYKLAWARHWLTCPLLSVAVALSKHSVLHSH